MCLETAGMKLESDVSSKTEMEAISQMPPLPKLKLRKANLQGAHVDAPSLNPNSLPLKNDAWKTILSIFLLGNPISRG